jgi:glycosyltransferase involved in cell wall biosynthesis
MKVLLVNSYAASGGASVAARRLCRALNEKNVDARLLVQNSEGHEEPALLKTADRWAHRRPFLDSLPVLCWRKRRSPHWGNAWLGNKATLNSIHELAPDVTHLHWINHGMLSVRDIGELSGPVVWTLHDFWMFTGGCHSPQDCRRFQDRCGQCPELGSRHDRDLSRKNWERKQVAWGNRNITMVTPSRWLAQLAGSASLLKGHRIEIIPNAVDTAVFHPMDRLEARKALGLPVDVPLFLFAAHGALTDWNKGADLWKAAMPFVASGCPGAEAILAGASDGVEEQSVPVHELGHLSPERMAMALSAADAVVVPSRMENLPNIVAESLACGTPVAAFAVGGIPEMIRPGETGMLASPQDPEDLARGICELLKQGGGMREACAAFALETYAPETVARRHLELYHSLLESS